MPWKNQNRDFTLQEQVDQKAFYLKRRLQQDPTLRLVLYRTGHCTAIPTTYRQVGAHATCDHARGVVSKRPADDDTIEQYEFVVMLMGAVDYIVPVSLRRWIIRRTVGSKTAEPVQLASLSLVNSSIIQNVLGMAANEMAEVVELDEKLVAKHEDNTLFVYSAVDEWVPGEFMQEFQLRFVNAQHRIVPHGHAFMMEVDGTRDMAEHISQWVCEFLDCKQELEANGTTQ